MDRGVRPPLAAGSAKQPLDRAGPRSSANDAVVQATLRDPRFIELVKTRSAFAWMLSIVMLAVYLAFILLVAFFPEVMATKIDGGTTSLGILIGLAVIVFAFCLTGVYVARANGRFDELTQDLKGRAQ